jgi:GT2 family glycosyltransferase
VLNPDVLFTEDCVSVLASYLDSKPGVVLAMPELLNADGSVQALPRLRPCLRYVLARRRAARGSQSARVQRLVGEYTTPPGPGNEVQTCSGSFFMIRSAALLQLGGFDERYFLYFEDNDLAARAKQLGTLALVPAAHAVHGYERAALHNHSALAHQLRSMLRFFNRYGW